MPRILFEKKGNAIWISHLDLMRLFQRTFKRAGLPLKHTQGFNPRPSVSIALPLSVGVESSCELLDFDLDGAIVPNEEICTRLNEALVEGVTVRKVYDEAAKLKHLAFLECNVDLEYDAGIPVGTEEAISALFAQAEVTVEKKSKNGPVEQNIIPMIRKLEVQRLTEQELRLHGVVCCQSPTLNPMLLAAAVEKYLPDRKPDFAKCSRIEIFDTQEAIFR